MMKPTIRTDLDMYSRTSFWIAIASICTLAGGCVSMDTPRGYAELDDSYPFDFKAVSARGNVIALSEFDNEDDSVGLPFWAEAVEYQKVELDGYKLISREELRTNADVFGTLFTFEVGEGPDAILYLIAVFVDGDDIYVVEAGGAVEAIEAEMDDIKAAMKTVE